MFCFSFGFTQESKTDSVYYLKGFEFSVDKNQFYANGTKHQLIDSTAKNTFENLTVAELLSRKTPVFIKNYGPGALATPSFRGTSANHTAVVWNGFNLQSPMNGTFDLSLLPAFLIDDIDLSYGGGSALFGSGAIGGVIHIGNQSKFDEGLDAELYSSYSSINDRIIGFKTNYSVKKNTTVLKLYDQNNLNTYQFENYTKPNSPVETQRNAKIKSKAIMLENYWQISSNQKLSIRTWYQNNERQIAPVIFSIYGAAMQKDENLRISAEWNKWWEKTKISVRAANLSDRLDYEDSLSFIATNSKANSSIIEAEVKHEIKKQHWLEFGLHESYIKGQSQGYGKQNPVIHKQAVLASYKGTIKKLNIVLNTRQEIFNSKIIPFTFSLAMDYTLLKKLQLTSKVSKNYRLPTFNDLYWLPGGNPDLQPEQGWCEEVGANYTFKKNNFNAEVQTTLYNKNITNWIIWLPQFGYWSPQNILQVWSRGFESALTIKQTIKKFHFVVDARYNYALSTNQKTIIENDASINKQLIYVPIYNAQGNVSVYYDRFVFNYNHTYTYYRYTSADNRYFLFPYQLSNICLGYLFRINKAMKAKLSSQVNNCFNTNYEVLIGRPMPLRFYQLSLSIIFTNKNK